MNRKIFQIPAILILFVTAASLPAQETSSTEVSTPPASAPPQTASPSAPAGGEPRPVRTKEDWSTLPLEGSGLDVSRMAVVRISLWDKGDYTEELLRAQWRPNDPFDLYLVRPKGVTKPPAILYLYDYSNETDRFRDESWCKRMTKGGFAAVGFVSAVSQDRIHLPRPMKEWFFSELQESLGTTTHDVQMIINYLDKRGDIDVSHVGMFGQGSGASIAVLAAAADPRITTLDLFELWGDWPDFLRESPLIPQQERANYLTPQFLSKVAKLDPVLYLPQLQSRHVRIEYVLDNGTIPASARSALVIAAPKNADVLRYEDEAEHIDEWHVNGLSGWIKSQLQPHAQEGN